MAKARYTISITLTEEENQKLETIEKKGIKRIEVFRTGIEKKLKDIK